MNKPAFTWMLFLAIGLTIGGCYSGEEIKTEQYYVAGEQAYGLYCANCHQPGGEGMANLYPPLQFPGDKGRFIQIIKHGLDGEIVVNGVSYNRPMPPNPQLTELDIAQITTYIYNKWGGEKVYTPIDTVKKALRSFPENDLRY